MTTQSQGRELHQWTEYSRSAQGKREATAEQGCIFSSWLLKWKLMKFTFCPYLPWESVHWWWQCCLKRRIRLRNNFVPPFFHQRMRQPCWDPCWCQHNPDPRAPWPSAKLGHRHGGPLTTADQINLVAPTVLTDSHDFPGITTVTPSPASLPPSHPGSGTARTSPK